MTHLIVDPAWKTLAAVLIRRAGGVDAAAAATRVGRSQISTYGNPAHGNTMPLDVADMLEEVTGEKLMTAELARRRGMGLMPLQPLSDTQISRALAEVGREAAEVFAAYAAAASDGRLTLEELQQLAREAAELRIATARLEGALAEASQRAARKLQGLT